MTLSCVADPAQRGGEAPVPQTAAAWWESGLDRLGGVWRGRRIAVVGAGRSGMASARALHRLGCQVAVTDATDGAPQQAARAALEADGILCVELGGHTRGLIDRADVVVVSPGVDDTSEALRWARELRRPVLSEIDLAYRFCPSPIIAVTGTNGKTSVVHMIAEVLRLARRPAVVCGNVGVPFSAVLDGLTPDTTVVLEISSFQLLHCDVLRPRIGVLLNVSANHLDRHHDRGAYLEAKLRLFERQTPDDWAVLNGLDPRLVELSGSLPGRCVWFGDNQTNPRSLTLADTTRRMLSEGAQAVLQVARLVGIADPLTWQALRMFRGLEHRLEPVATIRGVQFLNDSKSTTPDSSLFAFRQVRGEVVMILGGRNKGLEFTSLVDALKEPRVRGVVLIGETRASLRGCFNGHPKVIEQGTVAGAVRVAAELAAPGTTVLFSPACASFDMFRNFEERGRAFKAAVKALEAESQSLGQAELRTAHCARPGNCTGRAGELRIDDNVNPKSLPAAVQRQAGKIQNPQSGSDGCAQ